MIVGSMRERDFEELFSTIKSILGQYIKKKDESSWYEKANKFYWRLDQTIKASKSLITLWTETSIFAQSLVSKFTWAASWVVSTENLKSVGIGSTLKDRLESAIQGYKPYAFVYIADEMRNTRGHFYYHNAQGRFSSALMESVSMDSTDHLSQDSLLVLHRARDDKKFRAKLRSQCAQFGDEFNFDKIYYDFLDRIDGVSKKKRTFNF